MDARWILLLLSHKTGMGRAQPTPHIPASPGKAADYKSRRPRIQRRQHSSFLHLGATVNTFSLSCRSHTLLSATVYWGKWGRAGESVCGGWGLVPCEIQFSPPRKHQIGNPARQSLQRPAFSLMRSRYVLYTTQQGASPMPSDLYNQSFQLTGIYLKKIQILSRQNSMLWSWKWSKGTFSGC